MAAYVEQLPDSLAKTASGSVGCAAIGANCQAQEVQLPIVGRHHLMGLVEILVDTPESTTQLRECFLMYIC